MVRSLADRTFQLRSKLSDNSDDDELCDPAEGDDEYQPKLSSDHIAFILSGQAQFPPFKAIAYKSKLEDFVKKCSPTFREKLDKLVVKRELFAGAELITIGSEIYYQVIYYVFEGKVKLKGHPKTREVEAGVFFGEEVSLGLYNRVPWTIEAVTNSKVAESGRLRPSGAAGANFFGGAVWGNFRENANCGDPPG